MRYYTGVGSRKTPKMIQAQMIQLALCLGEQNWCLRSGAAEGADTAFELGAKHKQIFLPWAGFEGRFGNDYYTKPSAQAFEIAQMFHPAWHKLSQGAQKLHARNVHQLGGPDLDDPSEFMVCWTEGGKTVNGTATAIRIAEEEGIPIFNFGSMSVADVFAGINKITRTVR